MEIKVLESVAGKWGPQLKDEKGYLSFGKFYKGDTSFGPGTVLDVDLFEGKKGARYINSLKVVNGAATVASIPKTAAEDVKPVAKAEKKAVKEPVAALTAAEKDSRILVQGITQAVLQSEIYAHVGSLMDEDKINGYLEDQVKFWIAKVKELSGDK